MAVTRRMTRYGRCLVRILALSLTTACESARMPLEVNPAAAPAPLEFTSMVGEPARLAWISGLSEELRAVNQRIGSGPAAEPALLARAAWLSDRIEHAGSVASSTDEDAGIIDFGTDVRMSVVGPSSVLAYTQTSRATKIQHVIRITETAGGRTYAHPPLTDDSGFLHQSALYTSVAMPRCTEPMTVDARTEHSAESITFARQLALSHGNGSCSPPSPCPSDKTSPISYNCTGGGGSGGTTTVTCYTVTTEYYWYYPDTDTYEYRYTETNTWCESST